MRPSTAAQPRHPRYRYTKDGARLDNITDWPRDQFGDAYWMRWRQ